jgi:NAD(P)-dependent dehydrogenase (short-subunit alcohol dehydrogenase family)
MTVLDGRAALITGGGRGLGRAMALALAEAGATVAVCARSADELDETVRRVEAAGGRALAVVADVAIRRDVEEMAARVEGATGGVDVLVNNAGTPGPVGAFATTDPDRWWRTVEVNLRGAALYARAVLPGMLARGGGRIVNVSSHAALAPWPKSSAYAVSKAALHHLTENLAAETRGRRVWVFTLLPGLVRTAMLDAGLHCGVPGIEEMFRDRLDRGADIPAERVAELVVRIAAGEADRLSGGRIDAQEDQPLALAGPVRSTPNAATSPPVRSTTT